MFIYYNKAKLDYLICADQTDRLGKFIQHFARLKDKSVLINNFLNTFDDQEILPTIFIITPTDSKRITQLAALTRMRNTLWLVPKIFWIIVEDNFEKSDKIKLFLKQSKIPHVHLLEETPKEMQINPGERFKPKGVIQRNKALSWIRENVKENQKGVVFFGDDDNTYDIELFNQVFML